MTLEEELEELRAFKKRHEGKMLNRAFAKLEQLMENSQFDPMISRRAFLYLSEALVLLKDEVMNGK